MCPQGVKMNLLKASVRKKQGYKGQGSQICCISASTGPATTATTGPYPHQSTVEYSGLLIRVLKPRSTCSSLHWSISSSCSVSGSFEHTENCVCSCWSSDPQAQSHPFEGKKYLVQTHYLPNTGLFHLDSVA